LEEFEKKVKEFRKEFSENVPYSYDGKIGIEEINDKYYILK